MCSFLRTQSFFHLKKMLVFSLILWMQSFDIIERFSSSLKVTYYRESFEREKERKKRRDEIHCKYSFIRSLATHCVFAEIVTHCQHCPLTIECGSSFYCRKELSAQLKGNRLRNTFDSLCLQMLGFGNEQSRVSNK